MKNKNISILEINANYKYCRSFMLFFLDRQRNFTMIYDKEHMIWNVIVYWAIIFWCLIGNKKRKEKHYIHNHSKFTCLMELGMNDFQILLMGITSLFMITCFLFHICSVCFIHMYTLMCVHIIYLSLIYLYHTFFVISVKKMKGKFREMELII